MATLAELSLLRRLGAAPSVLETWPSLDVTQRHELLAVGLWPGDATTIPGKPPPVPRTRVSRRERECAFDLCRPLHMDESEVASRYGVTVATVRGWVQEGLHVGPADILKPVFCW